MLKFLCVQHRGITKHQLVVLFHAVKILKLLLYGAIFNIVRLHSFSNALTETR